MSEKEYRPYVWMGEECDNHVADYRRLESEQQSAMAYTLGVINYESSYSLPKLSDLSRQRYLAKLTYDRGYPF